MDGAPQRQRSRKPKSPGETAIDADVANPPLGAATATTTETADTENSDDPEGAETEPMRTCPGCGREVPQTMRECPYCQFVVSRYVDDAFEDSGPILHPVPIQEPLSVTPSLTPYIAAIVILFLVGFVGLAYSRMNRSSQDTISAGPSGSGSAVPIRPPIMPANTATPVAPDWHKVVKFKAQSAIGLTSFTIRGTQWRLTWSTKPPASRPGIFSVTLTSTTNPATVPIARTDQSKQETVSMTGPGDFALDINSPQPCLIMVEDYY
jgi:hypothetical protein